MPMHPYLPHLLQDIKKAHRNTDDFPGLPEPTSFEEEMEQIESWVSGEHERPFSYYTGLAKNNFPPVRQLSNEDLKTILSAMNKMLSTWNASIDFPENLPLINQYNLMVSILDRAFTPVNTGFIGFDFCTGYAPGCELGEYCPCLEIWKENDLSS